MKITSMGLFWDTVKVPLTALILTLSHVQVDIPAAELEPVTGPALATFKKTSDPSSGPNPGTGQVSRDWSMLGHVT